MDGIDLPDGKRITFKEILREFTYKKHKDVICDKIEEGIDKIELRGSKKNEYFFILTAIPKQKIDEYIEYKSTEEERKKQHRIDIENKHKEFIKNIKKQLDNGEEMSLIWFSDNIEFDIWGKNENGSYKVQKKDTMGEFEDNSYEIWSIDEIISELEERDTPEEIIYQ